MKIGAWEASMDLYAVLGVPSSATRQRIRAAYRRLIFDSHPDGRRPSERPFAEARTKRINLAASILLDSTARARYDSLRAARQAPSHARPSHASSRPTDRQWPRESEFWPFTHPRPSTGPAAPDVVPVVPPPRVNGVVATALLAAGFVLGFAMLAWLASPIEPPTGEVATADVAPPT